MMKRSKTKMMVDFIQSLPPGAFVTYQAIEAATTIPMDERGKAILYKTLHKCERCWLVQHGMGIELDGANNAMSLIKVSAGKMDSSIQRTHTVCNKVMEYATLLKKEELDRAILFGSMLGAILATRKLFESYPSTPRALNTLSSPRLPHL